MEIVFIPHALITFFTGVLCIFIASVAWRRKEIPGSRVFAWYMLAVAEWNLAVVVENIVVNQSIKILFTQIAYIGFVNVTPLGLLFTLTYIQRIKILSRKIYTIIWVIPLITLLMAWTNAWHGWVWSSFTPGSPEANILIYSHGIVFWINIVFIYLIAILVFSIALREYILSQPIFRPQIGMIMLSYIFPLVTGSMYVLGYSPLPGMDISMMGFAISGVVIAWSVFRHRLLELAPIAQSKLIEAIKDIILVLDSKNNIIDANPAAGSLLGLSNRTLIGQPLQTLCAKYPGFEILLSDKTDVELEIPLENQESRFFKVHSHFLLNNYEEKIGRLVIMYDITALKKTEMRNILLYENANQRAEELNALRAIMIELSSELDITLLFDTIIKLCLRLFKANLGGIALFDPIHKDLEIVVSQGMQHNFLGDRITLGEGFIGTIAKSRKSLIVDDYNTWEKRTQDVPEFEKCALMGVPLLIGQERLGMIYIGNRKSKIKFTQADQDLLTLFAQQASLAIRNVRLVSRLDQFANMDFLTSINNRRHFFELAEIEFMRAVRYKKQLTVIMIDLDHFKNINDTYGHSVGDQVLRAVAQMISQGLRQIDTIGRIGGEEFAILLPETSLAESIEVAERIRKQIELNDDPAFQSPVKITISMGLATLVDNHRSIESLLYSADMALYAAKQAGRNKVMFHQ